MSYRDHRNYNEAYNFNSEPVDIVDVENKQAYANVKSASVAMSALPTYASTVDNLKIRPEFILFKPIYTDEYMMRLSNAELFDDVINSALDKLSYFVLGTSDEIRGILYPETVRPLRSELEAKNELKKIQVVKNGLDIAGTILNNYLSDQEIDEFEKFIHFTDKVCKLGRFLKKNYKASHVFGRAASYIEYTDSGIPSLSIPAGSPVGLKPLKPMYLGNVAVNKDNWSIKALEYRDPKVTFREYIDIGMKQSISSDTNNSIIPSRYLDADNVLYFVRNNNNMMREDDDFFFGHSSLQSIIALSEENRRLNQIIIPQINQGHWAGTGLWFFPKYTQKEMDEFFRSWKPGGHVGVGDDQIKFQETKLSYDYDGLLKLKDELKRQMLSIFGLPSFLMNFENVTNRATAETVVAGFNTSTIQSERSWIADILDEQWYPKLFRIFYPDDEFLHIKMKIQTEFENISFESLLEKAVSVVSLVEKGIMTKTEARNLLDFAPLLPEDYAELGLKPPVDTTGSDIFNPTAPNILQTLLQNQQANTAATAGTAGQPDSLTANKNLVTKLITGKGGV